ncbi:uncharacterized protein LOC115749465 isoform X2 [Rhodamnia argentea]|uniref:Uncharacterized protein LOC115749465 isoform X2 n=1 Tax=Rhodamnia argentea TaxID=178133 RepID=A0ABM3HQ61_9MYRT|nr:uncharacterized protein LOC115749465 isoform X2 [Rhodamnia argentea]
MATSAFRSTTKRTPIGASSASTDGSASSNRSSAHRRSRSVSRFSHRLAEPEDSFGNDKPAPRGRFVNTTRGSGLPEISLDDLAIEFFGSEDRGRSSLRNTDVSPKKGETASQRRGRSVSRQRSRVGGGKGNVFEGSGAGRVAAESNSRRRRSVSVVRCQISDSESDVDNSRSSLGYPNNKIVGNGNKQKLPSQKPSASSNRQALRRSSSQKDLKSYDGYSSHSSALTDDEAKDAYFGKNGSERTIRAVYALKTANHPTGGDVNTGLCEAMRQEFRHAMEEIKMEIEQVVLRSKPSVGAHDNYLALENSDVRQAVSTIRRNYATKLEQRGKELSQIVNELPPDAKSPVLDKPSRNRKSSNDKSRTSNHLADEAEKYIQEFLSNVEDTDISSLDGERSDTSSTLGGTTKLDTFQNLAKSMPLPIEMDGVVLPWLQWETSNDVSPLSSKKKMQSPMASRGGMLDAAQEVNIARDPSYFSSSSHGSWSPVIVDSPVVVVGESTGSQSGESRRYSGKYHSGCEFDLDKYLKFSNDEDFLVERWRQKQRIDSGGLLLCHQTFF